MRAILLGLALVLTAPVARATPMFVGLGVLPGGASSYASGVSAFGSVVVGGSDTTSGQQEAFRWTASEGMVGLGSLAAGGTSEALGVSADGAVVVGGSSSPLQPRGEAFRWTASDGMVGLGFLPGFPRSLASAVSGDGSVVVGTSLLAGPGSVQAFRWTSGGGMVGLGDLVGGAFQSSAYDISADGSVVVGQGDSGTFHEAFLWTSEGGMVGLGGKPSGAGGVSDDGAVVVGFSGSQAFRWTASEGMVGLGNPPSLVSSYAIDVSADGSVVVGFAAEPTTSVRRAFIWDASHGMRLLQEVLVNDYELDPTGWTLSEATGISSDGLTIVGNGTNPSGQREAWIAVIPEPSVSLLFALGLAGLAGWRRRLV